jgi:hypothetical protein
MGVGLMRRDSLFDPLGGPFQNFLQVYCCGMDAAVQGLDPFYRAIARSNLELMSLLTRRAQAYMDLQSRARIWRTPWELGNAQLHFWQTMLQDYFENSQRITAAWSPVFPRPHAAWGPTKPERDYITFPEPREARSTVLPRKPGERRAA